MWDLIADLTFLKNFLVGIALSYDHSLDPEWISDVSVGVLLNDDLYALHRRFTSHPVHYSPF